MGIDPAKSEDKLAMQKVLNALDDPDCRTILKETAQPMTAKELSKSCGIALSTVYRKLDLLSAATLVRELHGVHPERGRITRYQRNFENLTISITERSLFNLTIDRPKRSVDERLAKMWSEMRDEL